MKKLIAVSTLALMAASYAAPLKADDDKTEESVGFGSGLVIGAVAGGPIGAIFGAVAGAWLGDKVNESDKVEPLTAALGESEARQSALLADQSRLQQRLDVASIQLQEQKVFAAKVAKSEQLITGIQVDLMFRTNSSELQHNAMEKLSPLVMMLEHFPELKIQLTGHGDVIGTKDKNKQVAMARSVAVRDALMNQGIDADRIHLRSAGKQNAEAQLNDLEGRALDRRVRIEFVRTPDAASLAYQR